MDDKKNTFQIVLMVVFGVGIVVGVLLFATTKSSNSGPGAGGRITIWGTLDSDVFYAAAGGVADQLGEVEIVYQEYDDALFESTFVNALASGTGPDLIVIEGQDVLTQRPRLTPWSYEVFPQSSFAENFVDSAQIFLLNDGVYAFPLLIDPLVLYSNKDLLTSGFFVNPPETWNDVLEYTSALVEKTDAGSIIRSGIAMGTGRNIAHAVDIFSALTLQSQNPIIQRLPQQNDFDPEFAAVLRSPGFGGQQNPAASSLVFYASFADRTQAHYSWNASLPPDRDAFVAGDTAMYIGYASEYTDLIDRNPNLNFGVSLLPQIQDSATRATFAHVYGLGVVRTTQQLPLAQAVANTIGTKGSEVFSNAYRIPSPRRDVLSKRAEQDIFQVFNNSAIIARSWFNPLPAQVDELIRQAIVDVNAGREQPTQIITTLEDRMNDFLRRK